MARERGLSAIYLEDTDIIPQFEVIGHTDFITEISGITPLLLPLKKRKVTSGMSGIKADTGRQAIIADKALAETERKLDLDFHIYVQQSFDPYSAYGNVDEFVYKENWSRLFPSLWRITFPVTNVDDVLNYDPMEDPNFIDKEKSIDELAAMFQACYEKRQKIHSTQLVSGGYYCTLWMWPIMMFGLEWTLKAAGRDIKKFEKLLDKFAQISLRDFEAWSKTDIKWMYSHDDICFIEGPIMNPKWYRKYLFPWYKKIWEPVKNKGIKIIFVSDGKLDPIVDDLVEAGADGFHLEPCCNLKYITEKYGGTKVIFGNVDTKVLTFGGEKEVINEVKRCVSTAGHYLGYVLFAGSLIPENVPLENLKIYFDACKKYRKRHLKENLDQ